MELSKNRRIEIDDQRKRDEYRRRIIRYSDKPLQLVFERHKGEPSCGGKLPLE